MIGCSKDLQRFEREGMRLLGEVCDAVQAESRMGKEKVRMCQSVRQAWMVWLWVGPRKEQLSGGRHGATQFQQAGTAAAACSSGQREA